MRGSAGLFNKFIYFFTSSGAQRWAEREMGNTQKNMATLTVISKENFCNNNDLNGSVNVDDNLMEGDYLLFNASQEYICTTGHI